MLTAEGHSQAGLGQSIEKTTESQGHGKGWERNIQMNCYDMTPDTIASYPQTALYDIEKKHNKIDERNVSIKVSNCKSIDCGDIRRFL